MSIKAQMQVCADTELPENDPLFPDEVRTSGQKYLEEQKLEHEIQIYPGVPHGT